MADRPSSRLDFLQGTLDLLILRTLSSGPRHGHDVAKWIRRWSEEALHVETGSLYPALHRLEARGLVTASWDLSDKGKRARYYKLTAAGRRFLVGAESQWETFARAMGLVLKAGEEAK